MNNSPNQRELKIQACNSILQAQILGINALHVQNIQLWICRAICDAHGRARTRNTAVLYTWHIRSVHTTFQWWCMHFIYNKNLSTSVSVCVSGKLNGKKILRAHTDHLNLMVFILFSFLSLCLSISIIKHLSNKFHFSQSQRYKINAIIVRVQLQFCVYYISKHVSLELWIWMILRVLVALYAFLMFIRYF